MKHPNKLWFSTRRFTVIVYTTADGRVAFTSPLLRRFLGMPFEYLREYGYKVGGLSIYELS